ncbi:heavy metal translocating P-type ATPase [Gracilibacillus sp. YIM 98692]|uniref:heavy metal translocating P-type ATPase n=1 Tax=Gracilibacillus sp. YIM 98692 TaxID=2663532 RepID=UPI001F097B99|nr:heavy metal translocating P-type ATPase [Gracilibacillus sp. YIM 98692]
MPSFTPSKFIHQIWKHRELAAAIISGLIIFFTWLFQAALTQEWSITLLISAFIIGGYAKAKEGITESIEEKTLNVELLMIIAAIGAASIGYWTEGAILIFIFALSGALETYTENKSEKELKSLMDLQPETAHLITEQGEETISVKDLNIGNQILIKAGERVPADGIVKKGNTIIDESALTGESIPVAKQKDDKVYAGTMNDNGSITVEINTLPNETLFQRIIKLVHSAHDEKSPSQQFIERFENTYVKVVLIVVGLMMFLPYYLIGWSWTDTIYRAMILLVVASPCALIASIMPATLSAISNGARKGILFKGGLHAEGLAGIHAIAFDKTGTLTEGRPVVTDVRLNEQENVKEVFSILHAIEKQSNHPLAKAVFDFCKTKRDLLSVEVDNVIHINGKGVQAQVQNSIWNIGSARLVGEEKAKAFMEGYANDLSNDDAKTRIFIQRDHEIIGLLLLKDQLRKDSMQTIHALNKLGVKTIMLTGDNQETAAAIANEANIKDFRANCLPEDKVNEMKHLSKQYGKIAMIGDGINDAPALATANLGIAMGAGSDVALETANIVLVKNKLPRIVDAIKLSRKMNRIIKQNIVFSITVILLLIASNFLQMIDLPLGVVGHEGSTILVILNGLRLLKG